MISEIGNKMKMIDIIWLQTRNKLGKPIAKLVFYLLMAMVLVNYFRLVYENIGTDEIHMIYALRFRALCDDTDWLVSTFYQYIPIIAVLPVGFAFCDDKDSNIAVYIRTRIGAKAYIYGLYISTALATLIVFALPFLIEYALFFIAFGTKGQLGVMGKELAQQDLYRCYLFSEGFMASEWMYGLLLVIVFALVCTAISLMTVAFSTLYSKYKVMLFVPGFLLINGLVVLGSAYSLKINTNLIRYVRWYGLAHSVGTYDIGEADCNEIAFLVVVAAVYLISYLVIRFRLKKDWLD